MAWQQEPNRTLWLATANGNLRSLTLDREQDVLGWAQHPLENGFCESLASFTGATSDELFAINRRVINGQTVRYIEKLDSSLYVDAGSILTAGSPQTVWAGLGHLEGERVSINADGNNTGEFTVTGGSITLQRGARNVQVGKKINFELELLDPEMQGGAGSASGNNMRISRATLRVLNTSEIKVNNQPMILRKLDTPNTLDNPYPIVTGQTEIENLGWGKGQCKITISNDSPLPAHVLNVALVLTIND
jgi:hypothetical protein